MASVLDQTRLSALVQAIGTPAVAALIAEGAHDLREQLARLGCLLSARQFDEARALAHRLRGRVASFGCETLSQRLETVERVLRPGLAPAFSDRSINALSELGDRTALELSRAVSRLLED